MDWWDSSGSSRSESDDDRLFQSSVEEVHHALFHVLRMLHQALDLHTVALLILDDSGKTLRIAELVTDAEDAIATGPIGAGEGAIAAIALRGQTMNLENLRAGYKGLSYYATPPGVATFLGVPIVDQGKIVEVKKGATTAHVKIDVGGGQVVTAAITNEAADELGLAPGKDAYAVIKASDVMIGVD